MTSIHSGSKQSEPTKYNMKAIKKCEACLCFKLSSEVAFCLFTHGTQMGLTCTVHFHMVSQTARYKRELQSRSSIRMRTKQVYPMCRRRRHTEVSGLQERRFLESALLAAIIPVTEAHRRYFMRSWFQHTAEQHSEC